MTTRRDFLRQAGIVSAVTLALPALDGCADPMLH
jgi:hypothetical protein